MGAERVLDKLHLAHSLESNVAQRAGNKLHRKEKKNAAFVEKYDYP
jgi:hypothetical protein